MVSKVSGSPRRPLRESAAAINQASYSWQASTRDTGKSDRAFFARCNSFGPSSFGQQFSQSQSSKMKMPPVPSNFLAARSTVLSNSPCLIKRLAGTLQNGFDCYLLAGNDFGGNSPNEHRDGFNFPMAFHNDCHPDTAHFKNSPNNSS